MKNGELKGWWIGLGPMELAERDQLPRGRRQCAPLVLVKDQKDAAGFHWSVADRIDEGR